MKNKVPCHSLPTPESKADEFTRLYADLQPRVLRYLSRMVGPDQAEDLTQEVFHRVSLNLGQFKGEAKPSTWVFRIATNAAIDRLRSARQTEPAAPSGQTVAPSAQTILPRLPDEMVVEQEMNACIEEFIDRLPLNYRTILILGEMEGFSTRELAQALGISPENVKVRRHRARAALKKALEKGCDFYFNDKDALVCDRKQTPS